MQAPNLDSNVTGLGRHDLTAESPLRPFHSVAPGFLLRGPYIPKEPPSNP